MDRRLALLPTLLLLVSCSGEPAPEPPAEAPPDTPAVLPEGVEAISLLGRELRPPDGDYALFDHIYLARAQAEAAWERTPENVDSIIWFGRRTAYLGKYRDAIAIYTRGIELHPDEARLYRHRGHRYISVREFDRAIDDFTQAVRLIEGTDDQVEPDGLPNAAGIPTSTLHFNIWYHLGLAH